jgi:hypothetical protein
MTQPKAAHEQQAAVKYAHPKVLLVDLHGSVAEALTSAGFNVQTGTFGTPYWVDGSKGNFAPVVSDCALPAHLEEQEVIVIDLIPSKVPGKVNVLPEPAGKPTLWANSHSPIDPRPPAMIHARPAFDRIVAHGGIFVIFAAPRQSSTYLVAPSNGFGGPKPRSEKFACDNWSFLTCLGEHQVEIGQHRGEEMSVGDPRSRLDELLLRHLPGSTYCCTIDHMPPSLEWRVLARNKYNAPVACIGLERQRGGLVLLLPDLRDKAAFLTAFLQDVLPDWAPRLFPAAEGAGWLHSPEYELPAVIARQRQITEVEEQARQQVAALKQEMEQERQDQAYLYDLIRGTDRQLVLAVMKAFAVLGFQDVRDIDEATKAAAGGPALREDLQIHDRAPVLVVDVKGVGGRPADDEALQAQKHASIRTYEDRSQEYQGLTIINHERHLPPLERENRMPFRDEIIMAARVPPLGLMTAWDLWRLVRNCQKHDWRPEDVLPIFYRTGRIEIVPEHYQYIGTVAEIWRHAFGVILEAGELRPGDRIALETPLEFEEQKVETLQVNSQEVPLASVGDPTGIVPLFPKGIMRKGARLFRVLSEPVG